MHSFVNAAGGRVGRRRDLLCVTGTEPPGQVRAPATRTWHWTRTSGRLCSALVNLSLEARLAGGRGSRGAMGRDED